MFRWLTWIRIPDQTDRARTVHNQQRSRTTDPGPFAAASTVRPSDAGPLLHSTLVTGGSRLSEGTIIQASVRARVFGVRLLRLEARIEAAPARLEKTKHIVPTLNSSAQPCSETRSRRDPPVPTAPRLQPSTRQGRVVGERLDEALGLLDEAAVSLATTSVTLERRLNNDRGAGKKRPSPKEPMFLSGPGPR
jgi:hypothetical protein